MKVSFTRRPDRNGRWETYISSNQWPKEMYGWLHQTYGNPGQDNGWDAHGGWLVFWREDYVNWFVLRWSQ